MTKRRPQVVLGTVHGHAVEGVTFDSFINVLLRAPHLVQGVLSISSGPALFHGRNQLTSAFLDDPAHEWLLSLDSDMVFTAEHVERMLGVVTEHPEVKVLGGLTWICQDAHPGPENMIPNVWGRLGSDEPVIASGELALDTLLEVAATGAACLLIHRSVFEAIGADWWDHLSAPLGDGTSGLLSEDASFCMRVRSAGMQVYVHTGIEFGHVKRQILDSGLLT